MNEESMRFEQEREKQLSQLRDRQNEELSKFCVENNVLSSSLRQQPSIPKTPQSMLRSFHTDHQKSVDLTPSSSLSVSSNLKSLNQYRSNNMTPKRFYEDQKIGNGSALSSKGLYTNESSVTNATAEDSLTKKFSQL